MIRKDFFLVFSGMKPVACKFLAEECRLFDVIEPSLTCDWLRAILRVESVGEG